MVKLVKFEINLNKEPRNIYQAGETITGHVLLEIDEPMKVKGIVLIIEGVSNVAVPGRKNTTHKAKEKYFENKIPLYGKDRDGLEEQPELPTGSHSFPFQWQVFPGLPSSFEGMLGHVRYSMKASIKQSWKLLADTVLKWFFVVSPLDLNTEPCAQLGDQGSASESYCCVCCSTDPVAAEFSVARRGYVVGDVMHMKAKINNYSRNNVKKFRVELYSIQHFTADGYHARRRQLIKYIEKKFIAAGKEDKRDNMRMAVPQLPPSHLHNCNIIDVTYRLQLTVYPDACCSKNIAVPLEIIIGTIPHIEAQQQSEEGAVCATQPQSIHNLGLPTQQQFAPDAEAPFVQFGHSNGLSNNGLDLEEQNLSERKSHLPTPGYNADLQAPQPSNQHPYSSHQQSVNQAMSQSLHQQPSNHHLYNSQQQGTSQAIPQFSQQTFGDVPYQFTHPMSSSMTPVELPNFHTVQPSAPPMELAPPSYEESNRMWNKQ